MRKHHLRIETNLQIVSSEAAHVLYDDGSDFSVFYFRKHFLESRTIEISPCIPIISEVLDIYKSIFMGVFFEILLLRWNLSRGFSAKHNVSENSVQNICRAVSPQRMRIIGSMVFFYL